jgi:hypothetical protein
MRVHPLVESRKDVSRIPYKPFAWKGLIVPLHGEVDIRVPNHIDMSKSLGLRSNGRNI